MSKLIDDIKTINDINVSGTTQSSNETTGALKVSGGAGIAKNVNIGGSLSMTGDFQIKSGTTDNGIITFNVPADDVINYTVTWPRAQGTAEQMLLNDGNGNLYWSDFPEAATTGSLTVSGETNLDTLDTTGASTMGSTLKVADDATMSGTLTIGDDTKINGTTQSLSCTSGSLVVAGGLGVTKNIYSCGDLNIAGNTTFGGSLLMTGNFQLKSGTTDNGIITLAVPADDVTDYSLLLPRTQGAASSFLQNDGSGNLSWATSGIGDVVGPGSATDNAVALYDGTTGKLIKNSTLIKTSNKLEIDSQVIFNSPTSESFFGMGAVANGSISGNGNLALGFNSGITIGTGILNTVLGNEAGRLITSGNYNVCIGRKAGRDITSGSCNVAIGVDPFGFGVSVTGDDNIAIGQSSSTSMSSGAQNICLGRFSGNIITTGSNNVCIGDQTNVSAAAASNQIALGQQAICTANNQFMIGNSSLTEVVPNASANCNLGSSSNPFNDLRLKNNATIAGTLEISDTTQSSAVSNGALVVDGGVGIAKNINIGGTLSVTGNSTLTGSLEILDTTESSTSSTGALIVAGGVGIGKNLNVNGDINLEGTDSQLVFDDSTGVNVDRIYLNSNTHGIGIKSDDTLSSWAPTQHCWNIGGTSVGGGTQLFCIASTRGRFLHTTQSTTTSNGALNVDGGVGIGKNLNVGGTLGVTGNSTLTGTLKILDTTDSSSSTSNGALVVAGGAIIGKNLVIGGDLLVEGTTTTVNSTTTAIVDPMFKVADGNPADTYDVGFYGEYVSGGNTMYCGLHRVGADSTLTAPEVAGKFILFDSATTEPGPLNVGDPGVAADLVVGDLCARGIEIKAETGTTNGSITLDYATGSNYTIVFPGSQGSADQVLINDGSGNLSWGTAVTASVGVGNSFGSDNRMLRTVGTGNDIEATDITINDDGSISIPNTTAANGSTEGSIVTLGGIGVAKNLDVGTTLEVGTTSELNGAVTMGSTLNVTGALTASSTSDLNGIVNINDTTQSTTISNGALVVDGGLGVAKNVNVGGTLGVTGNSTLTGSLEISDTTQSTTVSNGALVVDGGLGVAKNVNVGGTLGVTGNSTLTGVLKINDTTQSSSKDTGSLIIEGGVGIEKNVNIGGTLTVTGDSTMNGALTVTGDFKINSGTTDGGVITLNTPADDVTNYTITFPRSQGSTDQVLINDGSGNLSWGTAVTASVGVGNSFGTDNRMLRTVGTGNDIEATGITITDTDGITGISTIVTTSNVTIGGTLNVTGNSTLTGTLEISDTTQSSAVSNGALVVDGGVGIAKNINVGGTLGVTGNSTLTGSLEILDTTESSTSSTGALIVAGGVGIGKNLNVNGDINLEGTDSQIVFDDSTGVNVDRIYLNSNTHGIGIKSDDTLSSWAPTQHCWSIGGTSVGGGTQLFCIATTRGRFLHTTQSTTTANGALNVDGGVGIGKNLNVGGTLGVTGNSTLTGTLKILDTTQSTATGTAALVVSGGVSIDKTLRVGGKLAVPIRTVTADDNLDDDFILNVNSTSSATITLPDITDDQYNGVSYIVIKQTSNTVNLTTQSADKIFDGGTESDTVSLTGSAGQRIQVISNGDKWFVM